MPSLSQHLSLAAGVLFLAAACTDAGPTTPNDVSTTPAMVRSRQAAIDTAPLDDFTSRVLPTLGPPHASTLSTKIEQLRDAIADGNRVTVSVSLAVLRRTIADPDRGTGDEADIAVLGLALEGIELSLGTRD